MTRRRRAVAHRTVAQRLKLWDRKLEPDTYAVYLTQVKDMARDKFLRYQAVHEYLIKIVKDVVSKHPEETARQHAYMWFAQGLWYCTQRYSDAALQREADALFLYYLALGLREYVLREVACRLGVKISDWSTLLERIGMSEDVIYRGTKRALAETLHGVDVNVTDATYEYDPATGNLTKIVIKDKVTGRTKVIHLEYDAEGNLIHKWEEWV